MYDVILQAAMTSKMAAGTLVMLILCGLQNVAAEAGGGHVPTNDGKREASKVWRYERSSGNGNGKPVYTTHGGDAVGTFRGAAVDSTTSESPIITKGMIIFALNARMKEDGINPHPVMGIDPVIRRPEVPISAKSIVYYWDPWYLPRDGLKHLITNMTAPKDAVTDAIKPCIDITFSEGNLTVCQVATEDNMERCRRSLSDLADTVISMFLFSSGIRPTTLAWQCPHGTQCCEWECCNPERKYNIVIVTVFAVLALTALIAILITAGQNKKKARYERRISANRTQPAVQPKYSTPVQPQHSSPRLEHRQLVTFSPSVIPTLKISSPEEVERPPPRHKLSRYQSTTSDGSYPSPPTTPLRKKAQFNFDSVHSSVETLRAMSPLAEDKPSVGWKPNLHRENAVDREGSPQIGWSVPPVTND